MLFLLVSSFSYTPDATFNEEFFLVRSFSSLPVLVLVSFFFFFFFIFFFFFSCFFFFLFFFIFSYTPGARFSEEFI